MANPRSGNQHFDKMVEAGQPIGEVVGIDKFLIRIKGLQPCSIHALVMFEDGSKGFVYQVLANEVVAMHLGKEDLTVGTVAVIQNQELVCKVGQDFIGRVVSATGEPLDGKGTIGIDAVWPVFNQAPPIHTRRMLDQQVASGVTSVDALFPLARGQRMALLGDSKSGKSSLATQLTINQKNSDQVVVYVMIAKRKTDVDDLLSRLESQDALKSAIVVVSTIFDSLIMSYLAPYVACSMAEYLWQKQHQDTIIIYDDLTNHAQVYREVSLLAGVSPGRDSYPGDMFYAHSSLLERAGRLESSGAHLTSIPIVNVPGGDITAFLPTNIMSITDGQWILDMDVFREGIRPAVSLGLSVTRAGSASHNKIQKNIATKVLKALADYRQAKEFSHFGSELALEARQTLLTGQQIMELLSQPTQQTYDLMTQSLMLDVVVSAQDPTLIDLSSVKLNAADFAAQIRKDKDYEAVKAKLAAKVTVELKK